jgi:FRG domain
MEAKDIKALYKTIYSKSYIETGPRLVARSGKKDYISLNRLFAAGDSFVKDISFKGGHKVVEVPSPWHALCVAMRLQDRFLREKQSHLVFRGQSNSSYPLVASIFRKGANIDELDRAQRLLSWFLASNSGLSSAIDPTLFHGAAQHYQIWTKLLDITPDPAVATWFAAQPTKSDHPTASVYVFPLEAAERMGVNLRLPPPYVERLHRQRGIFIEFQNASPLPMDEIFEIQFPANKNGKYTFDVIRHGRPIDILADHSWIRKAVTWAKETAKDPTVEIPTAVPQKLDKDLTLFLKAVKAAGIPKGLIDQSKVQLRLAKWLDQFNDQIYWLAYRFDDSNKGDEELLEPRFVNRVVKHNVTLAKLYVEIGRQFKPRSFVAFHKQLDLIETAISERERATPHR